MDVTFLTGTILSGIVYDVIKRGVSVTVLSLKKYLQKYKFEEEDIVRLAEEINKIPALEDKSEVALQKEFSTNQRIKEILSTIMLNPSPTMIVQTHTGTGHNIGGDYVAGDKVVHPKEE